MMMLCLGSQASAASTSIYENSIICCLQCESIMSKSPGHKIRLRPWRRNTLILFVPQWIDHAPSACTPSPNTVSGVISLSYSKIGSLFGHIVASVVLRTPGVVHPYLRQRVGI
ncbi:hypothetical protein OF83DRAFT_1152078 [Amylostereum chailletii]|nr:hypothetical protein OF83DRAFT_1152078 [Amylostereum chailletii]